MSDRVALANAIEDAGIPRGKVERGASVIFDAIHDNVATKADVQAEVATLRSEMHGGFARQDVAIERLLPRLPPPPRRSEPRPAPPPDPHPLGAIVFAKGKPHTNVRKRA